MTHNEIKTLFKDVVSNRKFGSTHGYSKQAVYNYRHRECSLGQKLELLFNCGAIMVNKKTISLIGDA